LGEFIAGAEFTGMLKSCECAAASKHVSWNPWISDKQTRKKTNAGLAIQAQLNYEGSKPKSVIGVFRICSFKLLASFVAQTVALLKL
jgi:hypothetical protein